MSDENQIKCIRCGSTNYYLSVAHTDPDKFGYRCRDCPASWSAAELKS